MLENNFYVDNLFITGDSVDELYHLYKTSVERMSLGSFDLRSWNTNSDILKSQFIKDNKYVDHNCEEEKVLGYMYNTTNDCLIISENKVNANVNNKRKLLSEISKLYNPLSICLPVTIQSKILMWDLWALKV